MAVPTALPVPVSSARRKLSFKDKHALETLPREMAALEAEIAQLSTKLSDPAWSRDASRLGELTHKLGDAQARLAAAEERWLELEILREELAWLTRAHTVVRNVRPVPLLNRTTVSARGVGGPKHEVRVSDTTRQKGQTPARTTAARIKSLARRYQSFSCAQPPRQPWRGYRRPQV